MRPFVQTIQGEQSSTLKEDIKYLSLLNASLSLTNKWTPRSYGDMSWVSFLLKMLALLHPIISDCHCIVFDRRILSAFCSQWITALGLCILFSITQMTFTGPGAPLFSHLSLLLSLFCVVWRRIKGGGELIVWQTQAGLRAPLTPRNVELPRSESGVRSYWLPRVTK